MTERDQRRERAPAIRKLRDEDRDAAKGDRTAKQSQPGSALGAIRA